MNERVVVDIQTRLSERSEAEFTELTDLLERYNQPGPRYTSYPTIDQCAESFSPDQYAKALGGRRLGGLRRPVSLYVHIPFCESICYYCACNKVVTRKRDQVDRYLRALAREVKWVQSQSDALSPVMQLHLGGGTPTFLSDDELGGLVTLLESRFQFSSQAERSIEVDPRTVDAQRLANLRQMGFNRISFGVQDFNPEVQKAVHREQSFDSVAALIGAARDLGFLSINVDLIYGLPLQTEQGFNRTLEQLIDLSPDRVALYSYAHLPDRFKPQRRISQVDLPPPKEKVKLLATAIHRMRRAGYEYIGIDHFAKPTDSLAIAHRNGLLHRNFQGYTTMPEADLIGLGVSSISRVGPTLLQNTRDLDEYLTAVEAVGCAVFRGHVSDRDDLMRYSVIMALLCQGHIDCEGFKHAHWVYFFDYFKEELHQLKQWEKEGLITFDPEGLHLTARGWYFARPIAMVFDKYTRLSRLARSQVL